MAACGQLPLLAPVVPPDVPVHVKVGRSADDELLAPDDALRFCRQVDAALVRLLLPVGVFVVINQVKDNV